MIEDHANVSYQQASRLQDNDFIVSQLQQPIPTHFLQAFKFVGKLALEIDVPFA